MHQSVAYPFEGRSKAQGAQSAHLDAQTSPEKLAPTLLISPHAICPAGADTQARSHHTHKCATIRSSPRHNPHSAEWGDEKDCAQSTLMKPGAGDQGLGLEFFEQKNLPPLHKDAQTTKTSIIFCKFACRPNFRCKKNTFFDRIAPRFLNFQVPHAHENWAKAKKIDENFSKKIGDVFDRFLFFAKFVGFSH